MTDVQVSQERQIGFEPASKGRNGGRANHRVAKSSSCSVAPHLGYVSNFCGLKCGPLEPFRLLSSQDDPSNVEAPVQTRRPNLDHARTTLAENVEARIRQLAAASCWQDDYARRGMTPNDGR